MGQELAQRLLVGLLIIGLLGFGVVLVNQGAQLGRLSNALVAVSSRMEDLSQARGNSLQSAQATSASTTTSQSATTPATEEIRFPVVAYGRPGLLHNTEAGQAEKRRLEEKLIQPYTDFYNEKGVAVVALYVEVPENVGMPYMVTGIFCGQGYACGGTEGFVFGSREREYGYWQPPCDMDGCHFSEAFKKKYPQIYEAANR